MNLQQFLTILWTRKWLVLAYLSFTMLTTLALSMILPKQYMATTSLVVDQRVVDPVTGDALPTQLMSGYIATQVEIITSHNVATKVVDVLKLEENSSYKNEFKDSESNGTLRDWIADGLLKKLDVKPSRESNIIQISFTHVDAPLSASVANAFADAYIQTTIELRVKPAKQNADWFDDQLDFLRDQVEIARERLSAFQQTHGIVNSGERLDLEDTRLSEIARQLVINQGRTYELESKQKQLTSAVVAPTAAESLPEIVNNQFVQALKVDLSRAEARLIELSVKFGRNYPQYQQTEAEIANLKQKIASEIKMVLNGFNGTVSASKQQDTLLTTALAQQKIRVLKLKKTYDDITILNREVENAQQAYDTAMQRSIKTRMESKISLSNIVVLNKALVPHKAEKPKKLLNMILATFLGTLLGVGAALLAEMLDRRVRSPLDITERLDLPVFGVVAIPKFKKNPKRLGVLS